MVTTLISLSLGVIAGLLSIPVAVLLIEVIASLKIFEKPDRSPTTETSHRVVVIVPAHNESTGILPTIQDIKPQLKSYDRLIVVADNCSDDTGSVAAAAGAEVISRHDPTKIGKGYALAWAIDHLRQSPPDFVVFIDADCRIQSDFIKRLMGISDKLGAPFQARYLMKTAANSPINHSFAEFAWVIRNWARPLGLRNLGRPVQLMGTGMIFPWNIINTAPLASGHLVEDLKLGLDLAALGTAAHFFPSVVCTSEFPVSVEGTDSQRQRWVGGHVAMIVQTLPHYLLLAMTTANFDLLVLALDLAVPPLSMLGFLITASFVLTLLAWLVGFSVVALLIATGNGLAFALAVILAWLAFGRDILPGRRLLSIGSLIVQKLRLSGRLLSGKMSSRWIRTDRGK